MLPIVPVPRMWPGATIVILGSGPSLTPDDVAALGYYRSTRNLRILAINTTWEIAPWADCLYAPDPKWWKWHWQAVRDRFYGPFKYVLDFSEEAEAAGAERLNFRTGTGVSDDPRTVYTGGHSGYSATNVSVHFGASRIVLLGYDLQPDANGRDHHHRPHPDQSVVPYDLWRGTYETLIAPLEARGIEIVNASRATAITAIPRVTLEEVLSTPWHA